MRKPVFMQVACRQGSYRLRFLVYLRVQASDIPCKSYPLLLISVLLSILISNFFLLYDVDTASSILMGHSTSTDS
jgi:hypothetical protein